MKKFHLELGDPVVVTQGAVGDQDWGNYQFPAFYRTEAGGIYIHWEYGKDDIAYTSTYHAAISDDDGKTWREKTPADRIAYTMMKNGKRFVGFERRGVHPGEYIEKYTPVAAANGRKFYFAEDIEEKEDTTVWAEEVDPATGERTRFACKINWPHMPLVVRGDQICPTTTAFYLCSFTGFLTIGDDLYYAIYVAALDSDAKTREEAVQKYVGLSGIYLFKSADCGRTWDYLSRILVDDDTFNPAPRFEGFGEPMMEQMPDGSIVMLIRTGSNHPSYIVRSTDKCKTWTKPVQFDDIGVLPQIMTLPCGVTLASYGRPVLKLRATADPAGMQWEAPIVVEDLCGMKMENPFARSCFYTRLIEIADDTALLAYTDFQYPNPDGIGVKTVLVRTITVVPEE